MQALSVKPQIQLTQIMLSNAYKNYYGMPAACLGRFDEQRKYRLLLKFNMSSIPSDASIVEAKLKIYIAATGSGQTNIVSPYAITGNWSADTVTWSNQPSFSITDSGDSVHIKRRGQYSFDITAIIKKWYANKLANYGLLLKNEEVKDAVFAKVVTNKDSCYSPVVEIKYMMKCKCECIVVPTKFIESVEEVTTSNTFCFTKMINTTLTKTVTYFVKNIGLSAVEAKIQISPDGVNFVDDNKYDYISKDETIFLVPRIFAKYIRMAVRNVNDSQTSCVKIWYQAQQ